MTMKIVGQAKIQDHLDITPLVDVVFLLLIFFMLTSTFLKPQAIDIKLPGSKTASPVTDDQPVNIAINQFEQISMNDKPVAKEKLTHVLKTFFEQSINKDVILNADARLTVQQMMSIMDQLRQAGTTSIAIMTQADTETDDLKVLPPQTPVKASGGNIK